MIPDRNIDPFREMEHRRERIATTIARQSRVREEYSLGGRRRYRELEDYKIAQRGNDEWERACRELELQHRGDEYDQKEAETAVNDFLASFSTLYDDVTIEERTKVLDSVALGEEGGKENIE